ncbi:hypothetical protein V8C37DRAFT_398863 [Trichoderma ceciliae]
MAADNFEFDQRYQVGIQDTEESILHRKRELNGPSSSFSSNIGQRIPPHSTTNGVTTSTKNDGRSVKSIVAWLESASTNLDTSRQSGDDIKSVHSIGTISSTDSKSSLLSRQTIPGAADVEEYSLTLLKYKQYFTEVPLGRCLDAQGRDDALISSDVQVENASTEVNMLQEYEDHVPGFDVCSASDHHQLSRSLEPSRGEDLLMIEDKEANNMIVIRHNDVCGSDGVQLFYRDPEAVLAF